MLKPLAIIFAIMTTSLMAGCHHLSAEKKSSVVCYFRNISTEKIYVGTGSDRIAAVNNAHEACKKGEVNWNCFLKDCTVTS